MKKLVCIYTCIRDKQYLDNLKHTDWYKQVMSDERYTVLEVYADPNINEEYLYIKDEHKLTVRAEETYNKLSIKTFNMIKACIDIEKKYDYLVKLDATLIDYNKHPHPNINFNHFLKVFSEPEFYKEYGGMHCWENIANNIRMFPTAAKGMALDLLPENFSFYSGKCYVVDYNFSKYIASHGETTANTFAEYINGAEDLMIYKLHKGYKNGK